ncbi:MAG: recombination protein RecR, partial [Tenericutes bacterium]|nr:recombination protein RecR [Mycoplasmatota bacterium]
MYIKSIENLIKAFKFLPGIGEKTSERLSYAFLEMNEDQAKTFLTFLNDANTKIKKCLKCNNYSEDEICCLCKDINREQEIICVVDSPKSIFSIEKLGIYKGKYFVLSNLISPLNGINPEDINISQLLDLIKTENCKEIIMAVAPNIEGETTSLYIKTILENLNIKVSKLASGIPIGVDMDYIDSITLE